MVFITTFFGVVSTTIYLVNQKEKTMKIPTA